MIKAKHKTSIKLGNNFLTPNVIGRNSLTELDCIAEIIANSLDWRITKLDPNAITKITIKVGDDSIQIIDNGAGMNFAELDTAIDLAESDNDIRQKLDDEARKGMYGLGMKVATLSLGWKFTINTISHKDPTTELKFEFNSRNLVDKNSDYLQRLAITEESRIDDSPLQVYNSGTCITIEDLVEGKEIRSIAALGDDLKQRFSPDINNLMDQGKLEFIIIGEDGFKYEVDKVNVSAKFEDEVLKIDFEKPSQWAKHREYTYIGSDGKKYQLKGFLQLLKERSVKDQNFGLNLYCKGQLIERFHKDRVNGLFSMQGRTGEKTYGELHLDGCFPDNVKAKGFIRDKAFLSVRDLIKDDLEVYQYLSPTSNQADQRVKDEINKRKGLGSNAEKKPNPKNGKPGDKPDEDNDKPEEELPEGMIKIEKHLLIQINKTWIFETALDKKRNVSWEPLYVKSKKNNDIWELQVYINPNSNLYKAIQELYTNKPDQNKIMSFFKKMAICECIHEKLISEHGYNTEEGRTITDETVYPAVLKMKID
jgi:hypothetical protein